MTDTLTFSGDESASPGSPVPSAAELLMIGERIEVVELDFSNVAISFALNS